MKKPRKAPARDGQWWVRDLLFASGFVLSILLLLMLRDQEGRSFIYAVF